MNPGLVKNAKVTGYDPANITDDGKTPTGVRQLTWKLHSCGHLYLFTRDVIEILKFK